MTTMDHDGLTDFAFASRAGSVRGLVARRPSKRVIWVLHGRGGSASEIRPVVEELLTAMTTGRLHPASVLVPTGPWSDGAHWWVDSHFTGARGVPPGQHVESAVLDDVLPAVEGGSAGSMLGREHRSVVGISMGGAAAARWALTRPGLFAAAVLLSPACYDDEMPAGSSARTSGAFGHGSEVFDIEAYRSTMSPRRLLAQRPLGRATRFSILVGDAEPAEDGEKGAAIDLTLEAARLHARLRRHPEIHSSLRVVRGGHDLEMWRAHVVQSAVLAGLGPPSSSG